MRIMKTIKGEGIPFNVQLIYNTMTARVRFLMSDEWVIGTITEDYKYIILPDSYMSPYLSDIGGRVPVGKLKLCKRDQFDAKDANTDFVKIKF